MARGMPGWWWALAALGSVKALAGLAGFALLDAPLGMDSPFPRWVYFMSLVVYIAIGGVLMLVGILVSMTLAWRRLSPPPPSDDAAASVAFLRARLIERRRAAQGGWIWLVAPVVPGTVVRLAALWSAAGPLWLPRMGPILALCGLWLVMALITQWREGAKVTAEIGELDRLSLG